MFESDDVPSDIEGPSVANIGSGGGGSVANPFTAGDIASGFGLEAIGGGMEIILPSASFFFARIVASEDPFAGATVTDLGGIEGAEVGFTIEEAGGAEERPFADCGIVGTGDAFVRGAVADAGVEVEIVGGTEVL